MIESGIIEVEKELKQLEAVEDSVSMDAIVRYALISLEAAHRIAMEPEGLEVMIGPIPEATAAMGKSTMKLDLKPRSSLESAIFLLPITM